MAVTENTRNFSRVAQPSARCASICSRRHLEPELPNTSNVRAAEVARGKALVANPNYPSKVQIRKIAKVLATSLTRESAVESMIALR